MSRRVLACLLLLAAVHVGLDARWLAADEGVQFTDAAYHFSRIVALRQGLEGEVALADTGDGQRYGVLVYVIAALVSRFTGLEPGPLLLGLAILLRPLLFVATYRVGFELGHPLRRREAGLIAAVTLGFLPAFVNYGRVLVLDLPLAAAVAWAIAFLLGALRHQRDGDAAAERRAWVGASVASALALLIKLNAFAFLVGPVWVAARGSQLRRPGRDLRILLAGALVSALGTVALLFGPRGAALRRTLVEATWPGAALFAYRPAGTLGQLPGDWWADTIGQAWEATYYTLLQTLSVPWTIVALTALVWVFARRAGCVQPLERDQRDLLFWWLVVPGASLILLLRGLYDERYLLPLLPLVAGVVATALTDLPRAPRWLVAAVLLAGGSVNSAMIHADAFPTARPLGCTTVTGWADGDRTDPELWLCLAYPEYWFMDRPTRPVTEDWAVDAVVEGLEPVRARRGAPLRAVFLDVTYPIFYRTFQRSLLGPPLLRHEDMLLVTECWNDAWMTSVFESSAQVDRQIADADVVIMRFGENPTEGLLHGRRCSVFWTQITWFDVAADVPLPDGTSWRIWAKRELLPAR